MVAILIKSSVTWLCVQQLFQAAANDNIKALLLALCEGNPQVTNVCTWLVIFKSVWENIYDSIYFGTGQQVFVYNDALIKCFNEPCAHASDIRIMIIWSRQSTVASKMATQGDHPQVLFVECQCGGRSSTVARSVSI